MDKIRIKKREILEYVYDQLNTYKMHFTDVENARFHHNSSFQNGSSILENGVLCLNSQNDLGIKKISQETLLKMSAFDSHINDVDGISLSVVGLTDLDPKKFVYDPFQNSAIDIIITSDIPTYRSTYHYDNEYVATMDITPDLFRAVDIRLINYIEEINSFEDLHKKNELALELLKKFNYLREMAMVMKEMKLDIPLREMSNKSTYNLDVMKLAKTPQVLLK